MNIELQNDLGEYLRYSPLSAVLEGKGEEERWALNAEFLALDDRMREHLSSIKTAETIRSWITSGLIPETHGIAIAKIVGLAALGEIPVQSIAVLLEKLDFTPEQAVRLNTEIQKLLAPVQQQSKEILPQTMEKLPPMSRPSESGPRTLSPQQPPRNIIDLRKQQPNA